ncbi:MAG: D-arabinono-1,4-lactone oxidase [Mycetocola reblochoni]|uniref:D-arabinono-1,4-lactone oxidase n=1 Tax=Mycetocola reblochoni TaxID=331618 RepID=UPI003F97EACF
MTRNWTNWGRTQRSAPSRVERPADVGELQRVVAAAAAARTPVKVVGSGHSFSGVATPVDRIGVQLDLGALSGLISVDRDRRTATFPAATPLHRVSAALAAEGLALDNLGDIDVQTLAGATATGTHGTGLGHPGLAAMVAALTLVTADGERIRVGEDDHPELLPLLALGLGAFGVVDTITLRCVPRFLLRATETVEPFAGAVGSALARAETADHLEFLWFPHTDDVIVKTLERRPADEPVDAPAPLARWSNDIVMQNGALALACGLATLRPAWTARINTTATALHSTRESTDRSDRVFASPRLVRFREMEYAVPAERVTEAVEAVRRVIEENDWRISFPVEVRFAAADGLWLSTASGRRTAYIAVHRHLRDEHEDYFAAVEERLVALGGRPHWGKLHGRSAAQLRASYPRLPDALAVRDRLDPERVFGNPELTRILGD